MKKLLALGFVILAFSIAFAQENEKEPFIVFSSDDVPRYEGLAVGGHWLNQWPMGVYADFAQMSLGGGVDAEFTFPLNLPKNLDLGLGVHGDFLHVIPKPETTLKSDEETRISIGFWGRLPFMVGSLPMAFQPEIFAGYSVFFTEAQDGATANGPYNGVLIGASPALRIMPPFMKNFEIDLAGVFTITPEDEEYSMMLGYRFGLIYHIQSLINQKSKEKNEKKKALLAEQQRIERERQEEEARRLKEEAEEKRRQMEQIADEAEKQRIAEELRLAEEARKAAEEEAKRIAEEEARRAEEEARKLAEEEARRAEIASWPSPLLTATVVGAENFTPDGDGNNDKITFSSNIQYVEASIESWMVSITDPQGNPFRTLKGFGAMPETVEWDGKSDKGEVVASKNTYTANFIITPDRVDRLRTGLKTVEVKKEIHTGLLLQVIVPEHEWKIVVQTIAFDPDAATFDKLSASQVKANHETLDEVAQQIREHPGAKVIVEGYANNLTGSEKEEVEELIPLSQKRAETIVSELEKRGISSDILSAVGMGGANPLASRRDRANWWKNRRVEFKITK